MPRQQELVFRTWGGARKGAGRKPSGAHAGEAHLRRPTVDGRLPQHLTMRVAGVPSLRAERCMRVMRAAFRGGRERAGFRLVHYAVQPDHLHLVVEARGKQALSNGARALAIRIAMRLNAMLGRRGKVFADRYHAVALGSPRQVRRAIAYVLLQERRHAAKRGSGMTTKLDPCSSAPTFDGFTRGEPRAGPWNDTVVEAGTWLLSVGWRRHGKIDPTEVPGARVG
jgi:REP element-mobilizing transposase RayT